MTPFFSIIIPVYNVAPYLRECLDSVLAQTFTDWEAICVDDGSTDGSGAILDEYAANDPRFRVIHQENKGTHETRLLALELSVGEWITFLDADDCVAFDRYERMLAVAKCKKCDMVWGDVVERHGDRYTYHPFSHAVQRKLPMVGREILMSMLDGAGYEYEWHVLYSRIYNSRLIKHALPILRARRGKFVMCEDVGWSIALAGAATTMEFVHGAPYVYRRNDGSCTTGIDMSEERFVKVAKDFQESHSLAHEALRAYTGDVELHKRIDVWFAKYVRDWYSRCPNDYIVARRLLSSLAILNEKISEPMLGLMSFQVLKTDIGRVHELQLGGLCILSEKSRRLLHLCARVKSVLGRIKLWR